MIYYRAKLPHIHPEDGVFFITFRLADSLPKSVVHAFMHDKNAQRDKIRSKIKKISSNKETRYNIERLYFKKFDDLLAANNGSCWLKYPKIAQLVANKIHNLHPERYNLICYCIMPNHVHMLIDTEGVNYGSITNLAGASRKYPLTETLRLLKGNTARFCNLTLNRSGKFWHHENYDHYVRTELSYNRIIRYILLNPVVAGLVCDWRNWPFNYLVDVKYNTNGETEVAR